MQWCLAKKWKHIVGYFFFHNSIRLEMLKKMVSDCISKLQDAKLIPKLVIYDQDACHRSMFAKFNITTLSPNITINNEEIFFHV